MLLCRDAPAIYYRRELFDSSEMISLHWLH